jgi:sigma-B regulation protein RsbU (phosphoserine phosphatase)
MKIRGKLLLLLLAIALVPLGISAAWHHFSLYRLGSHLAAETHKHLSETAHSHLNSLVEDYSFHLRRDREHLEIMVRLMASRTEYWLAKQESPGKLTERALRDSFGFLARQKLALVSRQIVFLESGQVIVSPRSAAAVPVYDPRHRDWYRRTLEHDDFTLTVILGGVNETPKLIAGMPIRTPAGAFAGVAALEIPFAALFEELQLPEAWAGTARKFLCVLQSDTGKSAERLRIVAESGGGVSGAEPRYLVADEPQELTALISDLHSSRSGVRTISYQGRETHWVYGAFEEDQPFPLIVVSHEQIVSQAAAAEAHVRDRTLRDLQITGLLALGIVAVVTALAYRFSRTITRPLDHFAAAAERLAASDYAARVDIRTGDEFEELGKIFNGIGPKLQEREKMAQALTLAGEIQRHLLPEQPPKISGFDIAAGGIYCDETGGDYYDFLNLTNGESSRLGMVVGDVSGHGIGAALLMASARGVLRTHAVCHEGDVAWLFRLLNRHLLRDTGDEQFMTLFYGVLDARERTLLWNSAGHGPVLLRRRSGKVEELSPTGLPLGIMREANWPPSGPLVLEPGDALLIGTDGLWETRNPAGETFGIGRLQEVFAGCALRPASEMYAEIMQSVTSFRDGGRQEDDITLMIVKVRA